MSREVHSAESHGGNTVSLPSYPLGTTARFELDRLAIQAAASLRKREASIRQRAQCPFKPFITAYADVKAAAADVGGGGDHAAAAQEQATNLSTAERRELLARQAADRTAKLKGELESARMAEVTFRPTISKTAAQLNLTVANPYERLFAAARQSQRKREQAAVERAKSEQRQEETMFKPVTNEVSSAIVRQVFGGASVNHYTDPTDQASMNQSGGSFADFHTRMQRAQMIAKERRQALIEERDADLRFKPFISPLSAATVAAKDKAAHSEGSEKPPQEKILHRLYDEGLRRLEEARSKAAADRALREAQDRPFAPVISPTSVNIANKLHSELVEVVCAKGDRRKQQLSVVDRQLILTEAHRRHMAELKRATEEYENSAHKRPTAQQQQQQRRSHPDSSEGPLYDDAQHPREKTDPADHVAALQLRGEVAQRAKRELAAELHAAECPFHPSTNPRSAEILSHRRQVVGDRGEVDIVDRLLKADTRRRRSQSSDDARAYARSPSMDSRGNPIPRDDRPVPSSAWHGPPSTSRGRDSVDVSVSCDSATPSNQRRRLSANEFEVFLAKQQRHLAQKEVNTAEERREREQVERDQCTFRPAVNRIGCTPRPHRTVAGEDAHMERARRARELELDLKRREELVRQGKNPNVESSANDVAIGIGLSSPHLAPFSFMDEKVNPVTGSVCVVRGSHHRSASAEPRIGEKRPGYASGATQALPVSKTPSSAQQPRSVGQSSPLKVKAPVTGVSIESKATSKPQSNNAVSTTPPKAQSKRGVSAPAPVRRDVVETIKRLVAKDATIRRGFLR